MRDSLAYQRLTLANFMNARYGGIRVKREEMAARAMAAQAGTSTDDAGAGEDHEHLGLARKFLLGKHDACHHVRAVY